ncbi:hypothetical protein KFL_002560055 [Klebsormidium nitens]|uniref:Glycosyl transferase family 25 domain-containing protein n=1 Tax=Klebsormidium nitens TaxID=105231 RepID=A0A0U9HK75_KLENI|nr:hypothetical protein KFL_002560055 [Klebsormidium nitens]|eukprot:GAQ85820.1 hypothetical protein KFL_002560055 [Klebsormidium nitens]
MLDPPLASQTSAVSIPSSAHCYNNPTLTTERWMMEHGYGPYFRKELPKELRECLPEDAVVSPEQFLKRLSVFILTLTGQGRWEGLAQNCRLHGFNAVAWTAVNGSEVFQDANKTDLGAKKLKPGELGVLASMRELFLHAQELRLPAILVLEDDALLHKQFGERLKELLSTSARCSNFLRRGGSGGVLLLGATEWSLDAWNWIQDDVSTRVYDATGARCYNANLLTYGAFATIYHQDTYETSVTIVRVAYPYLAVADVSHASSVDPERSQDVLDRSLRHEWNLSLYHDPVTMHNIVSI